MFYNVRSLTHLRIIMDIPKSDSDADAAENPGKLTERNDDVIKISDDDADLLPQALIDDTPWYLKFVGLACVLFGIVLVTVLDSYLPWFHSVLISIIVTALLYYYIQTGELKSFFANPTFIYIARRTLALIPLFLAISMFTFFMATLMGDPVQLLLAQKRYVSEEQELAMRSRLGVDRPLHTQYLDWLWNFAKGDFGEAYTPVGASVFSIISGQIVETLKMQYLSFVLAVFLSIPIGILAAKRSRTWVDGAVSSVALFGLSMPIFVSGLLCILIFCGKGLQWFPSGNAHNILLSKPDSIPMTVNIQEMTAWFDIWWEYTADSLMHLVLPTLVLTFATMATYTRLMRSSMLEVLRQDYVQAARANGLPERTVIFKHALRNAIIPVVTYMGLFLGFALAGAPITETVFNWPGLGRYYITALGYLDLPTIMAISQLITVMILLSNLLTDVVYVFIDPRIAL